jgi:hypothetical protein
LTSVNIGGLPDEPTFVIANSGARIVTSGAVSVKP